MSYEYGKTPLTPHQSEAVNAFACMGDMTIAHGPGGASRREKVPDFCCDAPPCYIGGGGAATAPPGVIPITVPQRPAFRPGGDPARRARRGMLGATLLLGLGLGWLWARP